MTLASRILLGTAALGCVLSSVAAQAHGIYFAQRGKQLALVYGVGADDLDMVRRLPKVKSVQGYDADWKPVAATLQPAGIVPIVNSEAPITAVTAVLDNGIWSKDKAGEYHQMTLEQMPDAVVSEHTFKYAVHLVGLSERPAGFKGTIDARIPVMSDQRLQIIPVDGAIPGDMGKPMTVKVLFNGKPMAGVEVDNDFINDPDQIGAKTDANGLVTITVRNQGLNVITATYRAPSSEPKLSREEEHLATLSFKLPHLPE